MSTTPKPVRSPADIDDPDGFEHRHVWPLELGDVQLGETEDGKPTITVPISSTAPHRSDGKVMTEEALESMAEQLQSGEVGLWDDHGLSTLTGWREYRREDMYGKWVDGELEDIGDDDRLLWGTAELMEGRPETSTLVEQLDQNMPVGFSVGYKPLEEEMLAVGEDSDDKRRHIFDVDLWETSPVGIPDNPNAIAAASAIAAEFDRADVDLEGEPEEIASAVSTSVREALTHSPMSDSPDDDSTESADAPEAGDDAENTTEADGATGGETRDLDQEDVMSAVESGFEAARETILEGLAAGDDEDDEDEDDDDDDDGEAAGSAPGAGERSDADVDALTDRLDAIEQRNGELQERNEELQAKVDRLESETRQSAGRKGMSPAAAGGAGGDDENDEADNEASTADRPRNALEEAQRLGGL